MPTLEGLKSELFSILSEQFKEAKVWKGEEDVELVKKISSRIAQNRWKMLTGTEAEKKEAERVLPHLYNAIENEIAAKRIKLEGFGQNVMMSIVKVAVKVAMKSLTGFL